MLVFKPVATGEMITETRRREALSSDVEFGLVDIWRAAGRTEGSAIAAFVAVITNVQDLGLLLYATGIQVRDLDSSARAIHLLDFKFPWFYRESNIRPIGADGHADPAELITLQAPPRFFPGCVIVECPDYKIKPGARIKTDFRDARTVLTQGFSFKQICRIRCFCRNALPQLEFFLSSLLDLCRRLLAIADRFDQGRCTAHSIAPGKNIFNLSLLRRRIRL